MSQENVEIVRNVADSFEAFMRDELSSEAYVERFDPEIEESGVPIVIHFFQLWTIRDGKVRRIEYFRHRADALEAAGLSE